MKRADWVVISVLMLLAGAAFFTGMTWGLPSRQADTYLFGDRRPWTGAEIMALAPQRVDPDRGADVDANPVRDRSRPVWLNETDAQRAEIVRRYRLFTYQPDEMITMMALSGMSPGKGDFDPRLYQYGGLWIYPVGALLKVGGMLHLLDVRVDKAFYLDHPEEFGKFYVVARGYSAAWGLVGVVAVYWLVKRIAPGTGVLGPAAAGVCFAMMPAVVNGAHEAKPHLAGAVLTLIAVGVASKYVETGKRTWCVLAGVACGAALGMVVSGMLSFVVLPVMVLLRGGEWRARVRDCLLPVACGLLVYGATNPYVVYNAAFRAERLRSNLGNSTAMYSVGGSNKVVNAAKLVGEGASPVVAVAGVIAAVIWVRRMKETPAEVWLMGAAAGVVLVQFVMLAAGKPGEYGRFALVLDVGLAVGMVGLLANAAGGVGPIMRGVVLIVLTAAVAPFGAAYVWAFVRDTAGATTRVRAAAEIAQLPGNVGVFDEPAPYGMPAVNLFDRNLVLMPVGRGVRADEGQVDFTVRAIDDMAKVIPAARVVPRRGRVIGETRISWAAKRFEVVSLPGARASTE